MENYFESQRDQIFRGVEVLIYVFDIESQDRKKDMDNFTSCLDAIKSNSKGAHILCLIHKMDLIHKDEERNKVSTTDEISQNQRKNTKKIIIIRRKNTNHFSLYFFLLILLISFPSPFFSSLLCFCSF